MQIHKILKDLIFFTNKNKHKHIANKNNVITKIAKFQQLSKATTKYIIVAIKNIINKKITTAKNLEIVANIETIEKLLLFKLLDSLLGIKSFLFNKNNI